MSPPTAAADQRERNESFLRQMTDWVAQGHAEIGPAAFVERVRALAAGYEQRCESFRIDEPSAGIVAQTALVSATHDVLCEAGVDGQTAIRAMVDALAVWVRANAQAYSLARLGISPEAPDQAFESARENFKARGEQRFGRHFEYVQEVADDERSFVNIHRCLYHALGRHLGKTEVTPVFCAMDMIWAEDATRAPYNLAFQRPTTLAAGGDRCRFQFFRVQR